MPNLPASSGPIFQTVSKIISDGILTGIYPSGSQVPSTTELAAFYRINHITAGRALTQLTEKGILEKRRGIGTFVTAEAVEILRAERLNDLISTHIDPLIEEAAILNIPLSRIIEKITSRAAETRGQETGTIRTEKEASRARITPKHRREYPSRTSPNTLEAPLLSAISQQPSRAEKSTACSAEMDQGKPR